MSSCGGYVALLQQSQAEQAEKQEIPTRGRQAIKQHDAALHSLECS
jgi:hypothetical protein